MMRDAWIQTGRECGLAIDDAPKIGKQGSVNIQKYKQNKLKEEIEEKEIIKRNINKELDDLELYKEQLNSIIDEIEKGGIDLAYELINEIMKERERDR